jgi:hypothetical protein
MTTTNFGWRVLRAGMATLALASLGASGAIAGTNLVINGDFRSGNADFTTGYTLTTMTPYLFQNAVHGIYAIEPAGSVAGSSEYGDWVNVTTDPGGGNGNVFASDAATTTDTTVWSQTVTVTPNTTYVFSYEIAEISNPCCSNAQFLPTIDGASGLPLTADASWQMGSYTWNSGSNTSATLSLTDLNPSGPYNDFVLDDISLTSSVPEPAGWALMLVGAGLSGAALRRRQTVRA